MVIVPGAVVADRVVVVKMLGRGVMVVTELAGGPETRSVISVVTGDTPGARETVAVFGRVVIVRVDEEVTVRVMVVPPVTRAKPPVVIVTPPVMIVDRPGTIVAFVGPAQSTATVTVTGLAGLRPGV